MRSRSPAVPTVTAAVLVLALVVLVPPPVSAASAGAGSLGASADQPCGPGARTLSHAGDVLYPDTGNGGYRSEHTTVRLRYDAGRNRLLRGTRVNLQERTTQCLSELSLDLDRRSATGARGGPRLRVRSVLVDGRPAGYRFARPAYPGDPNGPDDPDPRAHQAGLQNPVGGPRHNPLPPACSPVLRDGAGPHAGDGRPCPASKLVITPATPVPAGARFTVQVSYDGRPGLSATSENGWFKAPGGGVTTSEPTGTQAWMPVNDHPSAKPSYDLFVTTQRDRTVLGNGRRVGSRRRPLGLRTTHWRSPDGVASYLVLVAVGRYQVTRQRRAGRTFRLVQDRALPARTRRKNLRILRQLPTALRFEERFNGPFPFSTDGDLVSPTTEDAEEMQTMSTFVQSSLDASTLYHENMHQWWGDQVSEADYRMTFLKEGLATFAELLYNAKQARARHGAAGFERSLRSDFADLYAKRASTWRKTPSQPDAVDLFDEDRTYDRPALTYLALYRILGPHRFGAALRDMQHRFGGATFDEAQVEDTFARWLPDQAAACQARLRDFFTQWWDTPAKPTITGPGLPGQDFYGAGCTR